MSDKGLAIQEKYLNIDCPAERSDINDEIQEIFGDELKLPECAQIDANPGGGISAGYVTSNGTVYSLSIDAKGNALRRLICNPEDSYVDTEKGRIQVCENDFSEIMGAVSPAKLEKAREILLERDAYITEIEGMLENKVDIPPDSIVRTTPDDGIEAVSRNGFGTLYYIAVTKNGTIRETTVIDGRPELTETTVKPKALDPSTVANVRFYLMSRKID